ncbi:MAG: transcriptional repressor LexA [Planctomycetaceae bacterium]|nr:transcriptional repressor LexA [Planctomycetales bacterium]MCB9873512.1 transcriptional repressor LexA [Planctomycetaceae bacterium]MCB9940422.1 transcriptional repressor LexA [Planctomycetaceae bacterium]HRX81387.1 transcriptional repressor LexA [Pirellulaceae bacterium]
MSVLDQLTKRQAAVYEFIRDKIVNRGYGPTVREIGERFEISSPNGVMCHLKALEKKGMIRRSPNKSRAIELSRQAVKEAAGIPMAGTVAAGLTSLAFEQNERVDFGEMFTREGLFALQVRGESMIEAQIADGDYVVVKKQERAEAGQMVVAQTDDGEATLKYWYPEKDRVRLQPANSSMDPIYLDNVSVIGVVVGVVRSVV